MIEITTKNGRVFTYDKSNYTFRYDEKTILIFENGEIVALYNLDVIAMVSTE